MGTSCVQALGRHLPCELGSGGVWLYSWPFTWTSTSILLYCSCEELLSKTKRTGAGGGKRRAYNGQIRPHGSGDTQAETVVLPAAAMDQRRRHRKFTVGGPVGWDRDDVPSTCKARALHGSGVLDIAVTPGFGR